MLDNSNDTGDSKSKRRAAIEAGRQRRSQGRSAKSQTCDNSAPKRQPRRRPGGEKKTFLPVLIGMVFFLILLLGAGGYFYISKYAPSKEPADLEEYFGVSGDDTVIYLNDEEASNDDGRVLAKYSEGAVYLPFEWVIDNLNRRFYYESDTQQILYTMPTETLKTNIGDTLPNGQLCFIAEEEQLYLNVDYVKSHTEMRYHQHVDTDQKRIFIYNSLDAETRATLKGNEGVRLKGGVKSEVLTTLEKGASVTILETMDKWSKVSTEDGFIGYLRNSKLSGIKDVTPESTFAAPDYTHITREDGSKVVLGFHQVMSAAANATFQGAVADAHSMNVVAPTWFVLSNSDGDFISYASSDYVNEAHSKGYQVWATVNNFDIQNIDEVALLPYEGKRAQLIQGLIDVSQQTGIDGLNIDFELVPSEAGRDYVQFMRELSVACRNAGIILSVDCYVPYNFNSYYDIEELGAYCDYVIIMCYDEHYAGGDAGSVASIGYVDQGIEKATEVIDPSRVIIAVPFYSRIWTINGDKTSSDAMGISDIQNWIKTRGMTLNWDETVGQNVGEIKDGDGVKKLWMEDEDSMKLKIEHIREAGIGGVAAWKLTQEPADFWDILDLNS